MKQFFLAALLAATLMPASFANEPTGFTTDQPPAPPPTPKIKVGDVAPDFTLTDQNGNKVSLDQFKGKKNVALAFYVFAFTGG
jgi:cytochrome oxidase Cu insertion factor (SCO1/SenC/PrrC family)